MSKPNPGSIEAAKLGCKCPALDNGWGKGSGYTDDSGDPIFWINEECPIHGDANG